MITTGSWSIKESPNGYSLPLFILESNDFDADADLIDPHFVLPFVNLNDFDQPQLKITVPDIDLTLGIIGTFTPEEQQELTEAQVVFNTAMLWLKQGEEILDLTVYTTDIVLDFSGEIGRSVHIASLGNHSEVIQKLEAFLENSSAAVPTGLFYQLGRSYMALGNFENALECLSEEIRNCQTVSEKGKTTFTPIASMPFNSQGVIYKKLKRLDEATIAFKKALKLRPNYFEALVSYITLIAGDAPSEQVINLLARAYRCQPKHPLIQQVIPGVAQIIRSNPDSLLRQLQDISPKIDLMKSSV